MFLTIPQGFRTGLIGDAMKKAIVLKDENLERTYQVPMPCVIGRGEDAHLKIPEETISHRHALISEDSGQVFIRDLGSRNGILVNGKRVEEKAAMNPGDSIRLGRVVLKYLQIETTVEAETIIFHPSDAGTGWNPDHQRLSWIYEMTVELSEHMDSPLLGERIFSRLKEVFRCDQFYVGLFQEDGSLKMRFRDCSPREIPISRTIVNRLMQTGESFILTDALDEDAIKMQESVVALRINGLRHVRPPGPPR